MEIICAQCRKPFVKVSQCQDVLDRLLSVAMPIPSCARSAGIGSTCCNGVSATSNGTWIAVSTSGGRSGYMRGHQ